MNTLAPAVPAIQNALIPSGIAEAAQLAKMMSAAKTVPKHLQESPGDCLMVVEQAMRWGMSPFAVAQATSVISGKLMYEGKLVAAAVETSGAIVGHLDYAFNGKGEDREITVSATRRGETNPRTVTVRLKEARTNNDVWKRQPDQQLVYHGARVWARRWTPAVILGVYSPEEMGPVIDGVAVPEAEAAPAPEAPAPEVPEKHRVPLKVLAWAKGVEEKLDLVNTAQEMEAALKEIDPKQIDWLHQNAPELGDRIAEAINEAQKRAAPSGYFPDGEKMEA